MKLVLAVLIFSFSALALADESNYSAETQKTFSLDAIQSATGTYFDWGRGRNGWGYCYEWTYNGYVLHGGAPVNNYYCEYTRPSHFNWGRSQNGWVYCYQWTPYGIPMNEGQPVPELLPLI